MECKIWRPAHQASKPRHLKEAGTGYRHRGIYALSECSLPKKDKLVEAFMTSQTPYSLTVNKNRRDEEVEALNPMTEEMFLCNKSGRASESDVEEWKEVGDIGSSRK